MKTPTRIVIVLLVFVCSLFLVAPVLAATSLNSYEKQVVALVNKQRAKRGLVALRVNGKLVDAARAHSAEMGEHQYFSHDSAGGGAWSSRIIRYGYTREGYSYWKAGENISWGAGLYGYPPMVVKAWMGSPAHRAVILTRAFRDIGIGAVKCDKGFKNCNSAVWFFTLDLGRRCR